jgi:acyl-CoA thioesterase
MMMESEPWPLPAAIPFLRDLGVQFIGMGNGEAQIALDLEERHLNSWQVAHGGVIMTLLDVVMSMAGRSLDPDARGGVTVEMKTSFVQPGGHAGARIVAKGKAFHRSTTMCFCEGEAWNGDRLVAKAMGTFKYVKRLDVAKKLDHGGNSKKREGHD